MAIYKLSQNEIMNIPRDRDSYTTEDGTVVPATTAQYLWLPLQRLAGGKQVIWIEDGADIGTLAVEPHTYIDSEGLTQEYDMSRYLKSAKEVYLENNATVTTTAGNKFDANRKARLDMADAILAADTLGLTQHTWRLANDTEVLISIAELKEAQALAIQHYAYIKGIGA